MRVFICGLAVLLLLGAVWAADNDDFNITVTVTFLDISLHESAIHANDYLEWPLGNRALSEEVEMGVPDHIWMDNDCNVDVDLVVWSIEDAAPACGFGTPTAWEPSMGGALDHYVLWGSLVNPPLVPADWENCWGDELADNTMITTAKVVSGVDPDIFFKFQVPPNVSDGCDHIVHVRVVAVP